MSFDLMEKGSIEIDFAVEYPIDYTYRKREREMEKYMESYYSMIECPQFISIQVYPQVLSRRFFIDMEMFFNSRNFILGFKSIVTVCEEIRSNDIGFACFCFL